MSVWDFASQNPVLATLLFTIWCVSTTVGIAAVADGISKFRWRGP